MIGSSGVYGYHGLYLGYLYVNVLLLYLDYLFSYPDQEKLLKDGNTNKWDVSLLCHLLLHSKFGLLVTQPKKKKAVEELRDQRNSYGHKSFTTATTAELDDLLRKVEEAYRDLSVSREDIEILKKIKTGMLWWLALCSLSHVALYVIHVL